MTDVSLPFASMNWMLISGTYANSAGPLQLPQNAASDHGLHFFAYRNFYAKYSKSETRNVFQRKTDVPPPAHSHVLESPNSAFAPSPIIILKL